ncbi:NADPH:quinone reductase [Ancylobacter sp. G4_0304]|uniref:NADPH:quinone reductase n=1 Tax=Ancylobacter sp. G4_0304 TaxID=3114289 RepID=UPI0039C5C5D4
MRAAWYSQQGPAREVIQLGEIETPVPGPGEILVRVAASGVNPSDVKQRGGAPGRALPFPRIVPHSDGAGTITGVGEGVAEGRIGQRVLLYRAQQNRPFGTAAEFIALPQQLGVAIPDSLSFMEAATIGVPGLTAAHAVGGFRDVRGLNVLITGAGGAVGSYAVALAALRGANVFALVRSPAKRQRARDLGARHIVEDSGPAGAKFIADATGGHGIDLAIDVDLSNLADFLVAVAAPDSAIATYGSARNEAQVPIRDIRQKGLSIHGFNVYRLSPPRNEAALALVMEAVASSALRAAVGMVFSLDQCAEAHEALEAGGAGKVVIDLSR